MLAQSKINKESQKVISFFLWSMFCLTLHYYSTPNEVHVQPVNMCLSLNEPGRAALYKIRAMWRVHRLLGSRGGASDRLLF